MQPVRITHAWVGWVAYTFDTMPHLGERDGLFYCMGYCGQGVPLAPYFGSEDRPANGGSRAGPHGARRSAVSLAAYYFGRPWFLAPSVWAYRTLDSIGLVIS